MKKFLFSFVLAMVLALSGCAGMLGITRVETLQGWYFQDNPGTNDYSVLFGLMDEDNRYMSADVDVDIRIVNESDEEVYQATKSVTMEDFGTYTSEAGGEEYLAEIRIPKEDVAPGKSADGTVYLTIHKDDTVLFDEVNCQALYCLPVLDVTLDTEPLPAELTLAGYDGNTKSKIQITDVTYTYEDGYMSRLDVVVSGTKTYGKSDSSYDVIGYKLYDSEDYLVESGQMYLQSLAEGDKFKDDSITFYDIVPGETYTLRFSE